MRSQPASASSATRDKLNGISFMVRLPGNTKAGDYPCWRLIHQPRSRLIHGGERIPLRENCSESGDSSGPGVVLSQPAGAAAFFNSLLLRPLPTGTLAVDLGLGLITCLVVIGHDACILRHGRRHRSVRGLAAGSLLVGKGFRGYGCGTDTEVTRRATVPQLTARALHRFVVLAYPFDVLGLHALILEAFLGDHRRRHRRGGFDSYVTGIRGRRQARQGDDGKQYGTQQSHSESSFDCARRWSPNFLD